jgi:hypothetical protein
VRIETQIYNDTTGTYHVARGVGVRHGVEGALATVLLGRRIALLLASGERKTEYGQGS